MADAVVTRALDLLAVASERAGGEISEVCAGVLCNECGRLEVVVAPSQVELRERLPGAFSGWRITSSAEDKDLCPGCLSGIPG